MNFQNISAWCIRNPVVPIVLFIGLTLAGLLSFWQMKVQDNPDIEFPIVIVSIARCRNCASVSDRFLRAISICRRLLSKHKPRHNGCVYVNDIDVGNDGFSAVNSLFVVNLPEDKSRR